MDDRLLHYYRHELRHIREVGGEFAAEYPKIADRLGLERLRCADPYVERLLEGFAFLAARVHLKVDSEFPKFTQHLLETVYPHYLAPTPSMAVVQFEPKLRDAGLATGFKVPRDSALKSVLGKGEPTACEFRTAHDTTLWPLELTEAQYFSSTAAVAALDIPARPGIRAGIRLRLRTTAGVKFEQMPLDRLRLYVQGQDQMPMQIYEQLIGNTIGMVVRPPKRPFPWQEVVDKKHVQRVGFTREEALLPYGPRSFQGYRLLHEYFSFPERYLFADLGGLAPAVRRWDGTELDVIVLLDRSDPVLDGALSAANFALNCAPAINLFPKRTDRVPVTDKTNEFHVVADGTRPMDFEIYHVKAVEGYGVASEPEINFLPFYSVSDAAGHSPEYRYFTVRRTPRLMSTRQKLKGTRANYLGGEVFISLVDAVQAPYAPDLRQLGIETLCTNRDLPMQMATGRGKTDFTLATGGPVQAIRCVAGPTAPRPSFQTGETSWRLISHLSLNYLSLVDQDEFQGAVALRDLLRLYASVTDEASIKQVDGLRAVEAKPIVRRISTSDRIAFGRGLEVTVTFDESNFEGTGCFLLSAVLDHFFAKYVSINSFVETATRTLDRGEIMRWTAKIGQQHTL